MVPSIGKLELLYLESQLAAGDDGSPRRPDSLPVGSPARPAAGPAGPPGLQEVRQLDMPGFQDNVSPGNRLVSITLHAAPLQVCLRLGFCSCTSATPGSPSTSPAGTGTAPSCR